MCAVQPCVLNSLLKVLGIFEISCALNFKTELPLSFAVVSSLELSVSDFNLSNEIESAAAFKTAIAISSLLSGIALIVFKILVNSCCVKSPCFYFCVATMSSDFVATNYTLNNSPIRQIVIALCCCSSSQKVLRYFLRVTTEFNHIHKNVSCEYFRGRVCQRIGLSCSY